jgi:hypothetical protein
MKKIIIYGIAFTLLYVFYQVIMSNTMVPGVEVSDHFDGKRYENPTLEEQFSPKMADVFKMRREFNTHHLSTTRLAF